MAETQASPSKPSIDNTQAHTEAGADAHPNVDMTEPQSSPSDPPIDNAQAHTEAGAEAYPNVHTTDMFLNYSDQDGNAPERAYKSSDPGIHEVTSRTYTPDASAMLEVEPMDTSSLEFPSALAPPHMVPGHEQPQAIQHTDGVPSFAVDYEPILSDQGVVWNGSSDLLSGSNSMPSSVVEGDGAAAADSQEATVKPEIKYEFEDSGISTAPPFKPDVVLNGRGFQTSGITDPRLGLDGQDFQDSGIFNPEYELPGYPQSSNAVAGPSTVMVGMPQEEKSPFISEQRPGHKSGIQLPQTFNYEFYNDFEPQASAGANEVEEYEDKMSEHADESDEDSDSESDSSAYTTEDDFEEDASADDGSSPDEEPKRKRQRIHDPKAKDKIQSRSRKAKPKGRRIDRRIDKIKKGGPSFAAFQQMIQPDTDSEGEDDKSEMPTFHAGNNKQDAMKELLAQIPDKYKRSAREDMGVLKDAQSTFGRHGVKPAGKSQDVHGMSMNWSIQGMRSTLPGYQIEGVAFMLRREEGTEQPRGGILADEMGLGKSVMALALVSFTRSPPREYRRSTLIIAKATTLEQWNSEVENHCVMLDRVKRIGRGVGGTTDYFGKHYNPRKVSQLNKHIKELEKKYDIVFTTYHEIKESYPKPPKHITKPADKEKWISENFDIHRGILHRCHFKRIILDEAHRISNADSLLSKSCRRLRADHFWAMTGTPVRNNLMEFYPLYDFINDPEAEAWEKFAQGENFLTHLAEIMILRTKKHKFCGRLIQPLPPLEVRSVRTNFSPLEMQLYRCVESRFLSHINMTETIATAGKKRTQLTLLMVLRQMTSHPATIVPWLTILLEQEDLEWIKRAAGEQRYQVGNDQELSKNLRKIIMKAVIASEDEARDERVPPCALCGRDPIEPMVLTPCSHVYCHRCLEKAAHQAVRDEHQRAWCVECMETYESRYPYHEHKTSADPRLAELEQKIKQRYARPEANIKDWIDSSGKVWQSAKVAAARKVMGTWLAEDSDIKLIVFSQWIAMIQIMCRVCTEMNWNFCQLTGKMSPKAKTKAIDEFTKNPGKRVLVASLDCVGEGLNLAQASKVLTLEPWWNEAKMKQALCRAYRIGQTREVTYATLTVSNTIDEDVNMKKWTKQEMIDEGYAKHEEITQDKRGQIAKRTTDEAGNIIHEPFSDGE